MRRLEPAAEGGKQITIDFEGKPLPAVEGEPLAVALLAAGELIFSRSVKYHRPRGPYCFSGACTQCLMRVDGVPNVFTCQTPARAGMRLERQNAYPSARFDVFAATDWLFPRGLDHHAMFAGVPVAEKVMLRVARHLAGLGLLPDAPAPLLAPAEELRTKVAVVGGGSAGLAAAGALAAAGVPFVLLERDLFLGGRRALLGGGAEVPALPSGAARLSATALALYRDEGGRFLAVTTGLGDDARMLKVYAERFLLTPGGVPGVLPFENSDCPGVISGRAASFLVRRGGLSPGERVALVGTGEDLYAVARLLAGAGSKIEAIVDVRASPPAEVQGPAFRGEPLAAHGRGSVRRFSFQSEGLRHKVPCDALVVAMPPSPSFELARQGGAHVTFDPAARTFLVRTDADGRTAEPTVWAAGDVCGPATAAQAQAAGARAGRALAAELGGGR